MTMTSVKLNELFPKPSLYENSNKNFHLLNCSPKLVLDKSNEEVLLGIMTQHPVTQHPVTRELVTQKLRASASSMCRAERLWLEPHPTSYFLPEPFPWEPHKET